MPFPLAVLYTRSNRIDPVGRLEALMAFGEGVARFLAWVLVAEAAAEGAAATQLEKWMSANSFGVFMGVIRTCLDGRKKRQRRVLPELEAFRQGEPWKTLKIVRDRRNGWSHNRELRDDAVAAHILRDLEPRLESLLIALSFLERHPFGLLRPVEGALGTDAAWLPCRGLSLHNATVPVRGVAGAPFNILLLLDPGSMTALTLAPFFICNRDTLCWLEIPPPDERKERGVYARPAPGDPLPPWVPNGLLDVTGRIPPEIPFAEWIQVVDQPDSLHRPRILHLDLDEASVARVLSHESIVQEGTGTPLPSRPAVSRRDPRVRPRSGALPWALVFATLGMALLTWKVWLPRRPVVSRARDAGTAPPPDVAPPAVEGMVWLPGGTFVMGLSPQETATIQDACSEDGQPCPPARFLREQPSRRVRVGAFFMDTREVTNAAFVEWLNQSAAHQPLHRREGVVYDSHGPLAELATADTAEEHHSALRWAATRLLVGPGSENLPVVAVTWRAAHDYCDERHRRGRLPTEAEWEFAARGTSSRRYPWTSAEPPSCEGTVFGRLTGPCPGRAQGVAAIPEGAADRAQDVTPEGIFDLAGNAAEWVHDDYRPSHSPCDGVCVDRVSPEVWDRPHVVRGGDWSSGADACRGSTRIDGAAGHSLATVGFRCVVPGS